MFIFLSVRVARIARFSLYNFGCAVVGLKGVSEHVVSVECRVATGVIGWGCSLLAAGFSVAVRDLWSSLPSADLDTAVKSRDVVGRLTLRAVVALGRRLALGCARGKLTDREWIYCRAITEAGWPSPVDQWP